VLHVDRRLPLVAVDLSYHVGQMHDGKHPGLAHLVEHLMFRGTRDLADGELHRRLLSAGARETNATTHLERTSYHTIVPADQLPLALWLESNRMGHLSAAIDDAKVDQERRTTIDEWQYRIESERDGTAAITIWDALFPPGHPYRHARPVSIRRLRTHHVRAFVQDRLGPANATLVLAGDLPADVRVLVERTFGRRDGGVRPQAREVRLPPQRRERRLERTSSIAATSLVLIAWPTAGLYDPGDAEADVFSDVLAAGRLDAMLDQIAPSMFAATHVSQQSHIGQSSLLISAHGVASVDTSTMLIALDMVLELLRTDPITAREIARARKRISIRSLRGLQRLDQRARKMQTYVASGKPPDWIDEDLARYAAVDESAIARFIRDELARERRVVVLAEPAEGHEWAHDDD
jgi:zinc protease